MFSYSGIVNHLLKDKQKLCRRNLRKPQYYDYPAGKRITPFQKAGGDSYFMGAGDIFTYLGNYEEIGNIIDPSDERSRQIQGAYVLNIFKRHSVIDRGKVVFYQPEF